LPDIDTLVKAVLTAESWDARVALVRKIPEHFGTAQHQDVYAAIAQQVYVPNLAPDFAYIHWVADYEVEPLETAYAAAHDLTKGFGTVDRDTLTATLRQTPGTLRVFRLLLGLTTQEFAATTQIVMELEDGLKALGNSRVKGIEGGRAVGDAEARTCAAVIDLGMAGALFTAPPGELKSKLDKPDTAAGWDTVRQYAEGGVPLAIFLHQRYYGGAFRQLLDATSTKRGDIIEDAVEQAFTANGIPHIRTGSHNQAEITQRFGITVTPAPDFVVFDTGETLRALLECKGANDGGTARDKAGRFGLLRTESGRLGGVPLFAVLAGLGWTRTRDALGPVVRDTDGRTFTIPSLEEMLTVQPFPTLQFRQE